MAWIKFDKALIGDPRILRATGMLCDVFEVTRLFKRDGEDVTEAQSYAMMRNAVTGALCTLWCYADTHIRGDDVLPLSAPDVDRLVGIEGFCDAIGPDWVLQTENQNIVILPGYAEKNGLISKEKRAKANAERQRAFREKFKPKAKRERNANSNGVTRGKVTAIDLDQDLDQKEEKKALREFSLPEVSGLDEVAWERWLAYRKAIGKPLKPASQHAARQAMANFGASQSACVDQSIANGWTGLFEIKVAGKLVPVQSLDAVKAWDALVTSDGAKRDARVQKAIDAVGGWSRIRERSSFEAPKIKLEFCRAYAAG